MRFLETAVKVKTGSKNFAPLRHLPALCALFSSLLFTRIASPAPAQDWPMFRGDLQHGGMASGSITLPLALSWRQVTNRPLLGVNQTSPIFARDGAVPKGFFAARDMIVGIDPESGGPYWFYPSTGAGLGQGKQVTVRTTPLYANGLVYVGASDGKLYAISTSNGELRWQYDAGAAPITASPIVVGDQLYFGNGLGSIFGLNALTGRPLRETAELFKAQDAIVGTPAYSDGFLYFLSRDQYAYSMDLTRALAPQEGRRARRVIRWSSSLSAPPAFSSPVIRDDMIYIVDGDNLRALTSTRGRRRWTFSADGAISNTPAVTDQGIFFSTRTGTFYSLDLSGKEQWKTEMAGPSYSSPVVARVATPTDASPNHYGVFVGSNRGFVYGFDTGFGTASKEDDGVPLWIYKVRPADPATTTQMNVVASPVIFNNRLYVLADDGSLLGFGSDAPDSAPPLVWGELPERTVELSGRPPINYLVNVSDDGSGIDPGSIVMTVDGQPVAYTYDEYRGLIYYKVAAAKAGSRDPVQPLPTGRHRVHVEVADWKGNKTVRDWTFMVSNNITDVRQTIIAP